MEYDENKALRAKEVAETKFREKEYVAAKFYAERARSLCPMLEYISILITIIDIYCSKEKIESGESDWNGVLRLEGSYDAAKICENFCNLAEIVQAGRNIVIGAEGAFQILSEAFCNVSATFWTKCSTCQFQFQYASFRVYKELVCINCNESYVAVPLPSGYHPRNQRTMSYFSRRNQDTSVVLALNATTSKRKSKQSKRMKKGDGESSGQAPKFEEDGKEKIVSTFDV
ncbi:hypothetical protein L6452_07354 [Arctium lappa]|uniref:Uncharacterized protein n=1 Tax=Arctium lappa TaxID=4217 RepID=A0ACB9EKG2_ARCLA|nr:hypothetical protein L6452_07354 [Arctium lappa]